MTQITTCLQQMRFRVLFTSKICCPAIPLFGNLHVWMTRVHSPTIQLAAPSHSIFKLYCQRIIGLPKCISISGKISKWSITGGSLVLGLISIFPRISYSMKGFHFLPDDHPSLSGNSDFKDEKLSLMAFAKKVIAVLLVVATMLTYMDHPVKLAAKLTVALLSSKPCPSSIYYIIEQCRYQYMLKNPLWYKIKPIYAKEVKVEDYKLMILARVELHDQKFTLIGLLGNWWIIQMAPCLETLTVLSEKD